MRQAVKQAKPQSERLLKAGLDLFSQRGFATVTIKEIAQAAEVNSALIYYYFDNKEALFQASIEHAILEALSNYERLKERHTDAVDLIDDWFQNNVQLSGSIRKLVKIMLDYANSLTPVPTVRALIDRFYAEETSILAESIRSGIAAGRFQAADPEAVATFASVHLDGIMVASMIRPGFDVAGAIGELREMLRHRLMAGE